jgi:HD-GYP domain-containing protein (c-di-GMP phosphodiesterase class II)
MLRAVQAGRSQPAWWTSVWRRRIWRGAASIVWRDRLSELRGLRLQSVLDQTTLPGASMTANRRYRVAVENLLLEMFVVELDRPWLDTPFLLQGFLIDSKVELDTLVKYCDYVYIDLDLSSPSVSDVIRRVEIREPSSNLLNAPKKGALASIPIPTKAKTNSAKPAASIRSESAPVGTDATPESNEEDVAQPQAPRRLFRPRADVKISQLTRQRFRHLVRQTAEARADEDDSLMGRLFGRLLNLLERQPGERNKAPQPAASELLPKGVERTLHEERRAMLEELPRARLAFSGGEEALSDLIGAIRSGKTLQMEPVEAAVDNIVESMLDNPDALMWIARLREEDINTYNHGVKVSLYLVALGRHLGLPKQELNYLGQIGMLADIGKSKLPRAILEKPGMLSPGEFELVKQHVNLTLEVLGSVLGIPPAVVAGIAQHHERIDGSGYPNRLKVRKSVFTARWRRSRIPSPP